MKNNSFPAVRKSYLHLLTCIISTIIWILLPCNVSRFLAMKITHSSICQNCPNMLFLLNIYSVANTECNIFEIILYFHVCRTTHYSWWNIHMYIPHSEWSCSDFAFTRERSRKQNEESFLIYTRSYVGRKRDGERDIKVFRLIWSHCIDTGCAARIYLELTGR